MAKVSVIIPAFNAMPLIVEAYNSVLRQTFSDVEIIIVDDGSTDDLVAWHSQLEAPKPRLISQPNQGVSAARNTGIQHASGAYIAFLDADDIWDETKLEKQVAYLDGRADVGAVGTKAILIDQEGQQIRKLDFPQAGALSTDALLRANGLLCGSTTLLRRTCLEGTGLFNTELAFAEDWELWIKLSLKHEIHIFPEHLVYYRQHSKNASKDAEKIALGAERLISSLKPVLSIDQYSILRRSGAEYIFQSAWLLLEKSAYKKSAILTAKAAGQHLSLTLSAPFLKLSALILTKAIGSLLSRRIRTS